jgi:general secretion pathway protein L
MHAPLWRPARWGLALLLVANLVGLNAWAWRTQAELKERRAQVQAMLTDTFPHVKVVVDAPAQMAREVAALRQASGAASPRDLEPMLDALAQVNAASSVPDAIDYAGGELRVKGVSVASSALTDTNQRLKPLGYRAQTETGALVLRQEIAP